MAQENIMRVQYSSLSNLEINSQSDKAKDYTLEAVQKSEGSINTEITRDEFIGMFSRAF